MVGGKRLSEAERQKMIFDLSNADACLYAAGFTELSSKIATHLFLLKRDDEPECCTHCGVSYVGDNGKCSNCGLPVKGE